MTRDTVERRAFLRRAATAAWASPVFLTVMANRASATHTGCLPSGTTSGACGKKNKDTGVCEGTGVDCCSHSCTNAGVDDGKTCKCA